MGASDKLLFGEFGQNRRDNIAFTLGVAETMICHFKDSGTDSGTDKYWDLRDRAKKIGITVNQIATITHIDGVELKNPIRLGTTAQNVWSRGIEWHTIVIRGNVAATSFEVYAS